MKSAASESGLTCAPSLQNSRDFFFSKSIWRSVSPSFALRFQPRSKLSLTVRAYLNTQKYGLCCSLACARLSNDSRENRVRENTTHAIGKGGRRITILEPRYQLLGAWTTETSPLTNCIGSRLPPHKFASSLYLTRIKRKYLFWYFLICFGHPKRIFLSNGKHPFST